MPLYLPPLPPGVMVPWAGYNIFGLPTGWLHCSGANASRTTYANLFNAIVPPAGTSTVTIATPAVLTNASLIPLLGTGDSIYLTTTGALPTGLTANTLYYVCNINVGAGTCNLSTSRANAYAATKINTTGSQSGVHSLFGCPWGLGDGSTTFTLPDTLGRVAAGGDNGSARLNLAQSQGSYGNVGATGGEQGHTIITAELASHQHGVDGHTTTTNAGTGATAIFTMNTGVLSGATGGDGPHNNVQPTFVANYIIKT